MYYNNWIFINTSMRTSNLHPMVKMKSSSVLKHVVLANNIALKGRNEGRDFVSKSELGIRFANILWSRSQWQRCLRRWSTAARLLGLWVRIPPGAWAFVCCECCVLSGRGLCDALITRSEESYWLWCVVVCDLETSRMRRPWPALGPSATGKEKSYRRNITALWTSAMLHHVLNYAVFLILVHRIINVQIYDVLKWKVGLLINEVLHISSVPFVNRRQGKATVPGWWG